MNRLPDHIAARINGDELHFRHGAGNSHAKEIIDSLNDADEYHEIELEIGGRVRIPLSEYEWVVMETMMERSVQDRHVLSVELVSGDGSMEVSLDIDPERAEVYNLQVTHTNNMGRLKI